MINYKFQLFKIIEETEQYTGMSERIYNYYKDNQSEGKKFTFDYFKLEKFTKILLIG